MKKQKYDLFNAERKILSNLKSMADAMDLLKKAIQSGTALQDKLILSDQNTVDFEEIKKMNVMLHTYAKVARNQYSETQQCLDNIYMEIQQELLTAQNMDSMQFQGLKKLRTKTTDAKKQLRGYSINKMEELAIKTVERINKASEKHYSIRPVK